ncbi:hypothetical protein CCACVL1_03248, partial [Corchorus capsularis]
HYWAKSKTIQNSTNGPRTARKKAF